jgi:hypothetical protein
MGDCGVCTEHLPHMHEQRTPVVPVNVATKSVCADHQDVFSRATLDELGCRDERNHEARASCGHIKRHSLLDAESTLNLQALQIHRAWICFRKAIDVLDIAARLSHGRTCTHLSGRSEQVIVARSCHDDHIYVFTVYTCHF